MAEQAGVRVTAIPSLPDDLGAALALPGRSQAALARYMGLDQSAVNRIVTGLRQVKLPEAAKIEAYLAATARSAPTSPLALKVAARLRALGLTPITAAVRAGLPRDTIRNLFRTGGQPRADTLADIARALDTTVAHLMGEIVPMAEEKAEAAPGPDIITITRSESGMWFARQGGVHGLLVGARTLEDLCMILPEAVRRAE